MLNAVLLASLSALTPQPPDSSLYRYWPGFPRPRVLLTVREVRSDDETFVLQSAAGQAARAALKGRNREMVWYPIGHPAYERWLSESRKLSGARMVTFEDVWSLVERLRARGIIRGYVLFRKDTFERRLHEHGPYDPSSNVATVIAAQTGGVLVSEEAKQKAEAMGLPMLADARSMSEEECFEQYGPRTSRTVVAMLDPKLAHCRAESIALNAFVLATYGPLTERALARLEPDSPVLGWGMGDEFKLTEPISRWGSWQSATNWSLNLPVLSTEPIGSSIRAAAMRVRQQPSLWDLAWEDGVHYASFLMTDGDNVQWLMSEFQFGSERSWWNSPARGRFPMGWGACIADLVQLCPWAWQNLVGTATEGDDLILMGGGYYYPDLFGKERKDVDALRIHARRMRGYLRLAGVRVLHMNATKWDSAEAIRAYTVFAEEIPELEGIVMVQYAPYTAGGGKVLWVKRRDGSEIPVLSARFAIWAHSPFPNDGTPALTARRLNAMPKLEAEAVGALSLSAAGHQPADAPGFSWVSVHCWSWFKEVADSASDDAELVDQAKWREAGAKRGLEPVEWCVRRLEPHVRLVTPTKMMMMLNLRLRPEQTLRRGLADLESRLRSMSPAARKAAQAQIAEAEEHIKRGHYREALDAGKRAATIVTTYRR